MAEVKKVRLVIESLAGDEFEFSIEKIIEIDEITSPERWDDLRNSLLSDIEEIK